MEEEIKEQSVQTEENKGALADDVLNKVSGGRVAPKDPNRVAWPKTPDGKPSYQNPKGMPHVFKP